MAKEEERSEDCSLGLQILHAHPLLFLPSRLFAWFLLHPDTAVRSESILESLEQKIVVKT